MAFTRITNEDRIGKGNVGQPDTPLLSATEMQEQMDSLPNLAIDKHNEFLDELEDPSASSNIGCTPPVGITTTSTKLYGVLNAIASVANASDALAHSHSNKTTLDSLTPAFIEELRNLNTMLSGITSVTNTMEDSATKIPTCRAVEYYLTYDSQAIANLLTQLYPPGSLYVTTGDNPEIYFPDTTWGLLYADYDVGIYYYERQS